MDGLAEVREGVHLADGRVDQIGLVPLPAGLVLLGAAVVVDGEQHPASSRAAAPRYTDDFPQYVPTSSSGPSTDTAAAAS